MQIKISEWVSSLLHRRGPADVRPHAAPARPFHAVTIVTAINCCRAAQALQGQRFLSAAAPRLPLQACGTQQCNCRYRHFVDRRNKLRRKADRGLPDGAWLKHERRATAARREIDA